MCIFFFLDIMPPNSGLWTIHPDGEVLLRQSKHGPGHEAPMTIPELFQESVNRFGTYPALASKKSEKWEVLTYSQYYEVCRKAAKAMLKVNESPIPSSFLPSLLLPPSLPYHLFNHSFRIGNTYTYIWYKMHEAPQDTKGNW